MLLLLELAHIAATLGPHERPDHEDEEQDAGDNGAGHGPLWEPRCAGADDALGVVSSFRVAHHDAEREQVRRREQYRQNGEHTLPRPGYATVPNLPQDQQGHEGESEAVDQTEQNAAAQISTDLLCNGVCPPNR